MRILTCAVKLIADSLRTRIIVEAISHHRLWAAYYMDGRPTTTWLGRPTTYYAKIKLLFHVDHTSYIIPN
jgi:hypothetical protein